MMNWFPKVRLAKPGEILPIRKATEWLTCRISDRPLVRNFWTIRKSRITDRHNFVTSQAACHGRDWEADPVMLPVIRNNRKSGLGTPRALCKNPFFPVDSEKNKVARVHAALEICKVCPVRAECRDVTLQTPPVATGIVQGGMVFVDKITEFRALIKAWNQKAPRSLRIPTKGRNAWDLRRTPTVTQLEEYLTNLTRANDFRGALLEIVMNDYKDTAREVAGFDPYDWADETYETAMAEAWAKAVRKHT